jgi:muconolactone delta-isomerase
MEYLVTMTTQVPEGTSDATVAEVRERESAHSRELAAEGFLVRLWRPPLQPGEWRTLGLFRAADDDDLEKGLASMPLRIWRTDDVTPLSEHPNDPGADVRRARGSMPEFFTTFTTDPPAGTPVETVRELTAAEAESAREHGIAGRLVRLWRLPPDAAGRSRALGLWRAADPDEMRRILAGLPMAPLLSVETVPLSVHPSDPAIASA